MGAPPNLLPEITSSVDGQPNQSQAAPVSKGKVVLKWLPLNPMELGQPPESPQGKEVFVPLPESAAISAPSGTGLTFGLPPPPVLPP